MADLSLQKSIRTCKVNTGWSNRIESDRFLNSANLMCPTWTGFDLAGRRVCENSFYTKSPGCNSSNDRIVVENDLRPDYVSYIALNAAGIKGAIYANKSAQDNANAFAQHVSDINKVTGQFGQQWSSDITNNSCSLQPYDSMMSSLKDRNSQAAFNAYFSQKYRSSAGI